MLFGTLNSSAGPLDLDIRTAGALLGNVQADVELRFYTTPGVTTAANEQAMLRLRNIDRGGNLVLSLLDEVLNSCNNLFNDSAVAFKLDRRVVTIGTGELDYPSGAAVIGAASLNNDFADIRTCSKLVPNLSARYSMMTYLQRRSEPCGASCPLQLSW